MDAIASELDIFGYNYLDDRMDGDRARDPGRLCFYTETFPTTVVDVWRRIMSHKTCIGCFVWTGIDYIGNASLGMVHYTEKESYYGYRTQKAFPWHGAVCGDIDEETIGDLTWVRAEVVDEKGVLCPYAAQDVTFEGDILGTCSGDMKDCVPAPSRTRRTWHGRAMAIRRNR